MILLTILKFCLLYYAVLIITYHTIEKLDKLFFKKSTPNIFRILIIISLTVIIVLYIDYNYTHLRATLGKLLM